ncbi:MAG: hypothetical protein Fur0019_13170 [Tibeticola sp.]
MPIAPLPSLDRYSSTFRQDVDAFFGTQLPAFSVQAEDARQQVVAAEASAAASAANASAARLDALAAAQSAALNASAQKWASGAIYQDGDVVWSPLTYRAYRRMGSGSGSADPSADTVNWMLVDRSPIGTVFKPASSVLAVPSGLYLLPTSSITITLPASPVAQDWVAFIPPASFVAGQSIARNGSLIMGKAEDMTIDVPATPFRLVFVGASAGGWILGI